MDTALRRGRVLVLQVLSVVGFVAYKTAMGGSEKSTSTGVRCGENGKCGTGNMAIRCILGKPCIRWIVGVVLIESIFTEIPVASPF